MTGRGRRPRLPRPARGGRGSSRQSIVLGAALLACTLGLGGWVMWDAYREVQLQSRRALRNIAQALDQDIARNVELYDLAVQDAVLGLALPGLDQVSPAVRHAALFTRMSTARHMSSLVIFDAQGRVVDTSEGGPPHAGSFADRDYFRVHLAEPDPGLYISLPFASRVTSRPTLALSRRLAHADGSFAGVAAATIELAYFQDLFARLDLGAQGAATLLRADGAAIARWPFDAGRTGRDLGGDAILGQSRLGTAGVIRGRASDGVQRLYAYQRVGSLPLIVVVGFSEREILAPWRLKAAMIAALMLVLAGLATLLAVGLQGELRRRARSERLAVRSAAAARHSAQQLAEALARLHALFANSPDALYVARRREDGRFAYASLNPAGETLIGLAAAAMLGRTPEECLPPAAADLVQAHWQACLRDRRTVRYTSNPDLPGGRRHWEVLLVPILDAAGEVALLLGVARDVTQRRRTEDSLQRLNETLEARVEAAVAEREAALVRAVHAERMQALGQLAGGIAHDFNNVLQGVGGCATLIERHPGDAAGVRRLVRLILEATTRGAAVTRRLLAFSRRDELRAEPLEPAPLLEGLREILTHTLGAGVSVRTELGPELPRLLADKGQLETVLLNLATNARDAMPGGGTLTLAATGVELDDDGALEPAAAPGRYVRLCVRDTGSGMSPATLARVTEPFFTTKPVGQGTGLGLAMAKGFAEQSGGWLDISSSQGRGTAVTLWLPQTSSAPLAAATGIATVVADGPGADAPRLLLVDDDATVREALAEHLADEYGVLAAASGAEALALLAAGEVVDALVTDLTMPGMDGLTLIREAQACRPGLPAVLLTGYAGDVASLAVGWAVSGRFVLLRKPITGGQLSERIATALAAHPSGRRVVAPAQRSAV